MKKIIITSLCLFAATSANSTVYTNNIPNACGILYQNLIAELSPNQYMCANGYFLPAYTNGCVACPTGATCNGGTFYADTKTAQGIVYNTHTTTTPTNACSAARFRDWIAVYGINCSAGYYLPANSENCTLCPVDSYCGGGTYTFNETVPQGIVSCGAGLYAPMGMSSANQCGRILHIGDNVVYLHSVKKTTPALHVDIDQDGTADYFGNMTTLDVPMTHGTDKKLKLQYDGVTYSVYDDSVDLSEYTN